MVRRSNSIIYELIYYYYFNTPLFHQSDDKTISNNTTLVTNNRQLSDTLVDEIKNKNKNKKREGFFFFQKKDNQKNKKRIIIVDDDQDIIFTYKTFLNDYDYEIICFTDPFIALNYFKELSNFANLLVILDIRMKNLNGLQLHQQIKVIDPTIKIIFITALDILDELLCIFPGISREQILKKTY